jgi:hypothetical protein
VKIQDKRKIVKCSTASNENCGIQNGKLLVTPILLICYG